MIFLLILLVLDIQFFKKFHFIAKFKHLSGPQKGLGCKCKTHSNLTLLIELILKFYTQACSCALV